MESLTTIATSLGVSPTAFVIGLTIISLWTLVWKALALWKSAKKGSPVWFVILLVVNTLGILEILYLFVFSEIKKFPQKKLKKRT